MKYLSLLVVFVSTMIFPKAQSYVGTSDSAIAAHAKQILEGVVTPTDDKLTGCCLDSLFSANLTTREHYSKVFGVIVSKSDGALSELVGIYCKKYLDSLPKEYIKHYKSQSPSNKKLHDMFIASEFYIEGADIKEAYISLSKFFFDVKQRDGIYTKEYKELEEIQLAVVESLKSMYN